MHFCCRVVVTGFSVTLSSRTQAEGEAPFLATAVLQWKKSIAKHNHVMYLTLLLRAGIGHVHLHVMTNVNHSIKLGIHGAASAAVSLGMASTEEEEIV